MDVKIRVYNPHSEEYHLSIVVANDGYDAEEWARHAFSPQRVAFVPADNPGVEYVAFDEDAAAEVERFNPQAVAFMRGQLARMNQLIREKNLSTLTSQR